MTKVLYTKNYGSGWVSENQNLTPEQKIFMLTHPALVEAAEKGLDLGINPKYNWESTEGQAIPGSPLDKFIRDWKLSFPEAEIPFVFGARKGLAVMDLTGAFRIEEFDGKESIIALGDDVFFVS